MKSGLHITLTIIDNDACKKQSKAHRAVEATFMVCRKLFGIGWWFLYNGRQAGATKCFIDPC